MKSLQTMKVLSKEQLRMINGGYGTYSSYSGFSSYRNICSCSSVSSSAAKNVYGIAAYGSAAETTASSSFNVIRDRLVYYKLMNSAGM